MCPALSTQVLFSPQPLKLFANETLYQLSYTPILIDFKHLQNISEGAKMFVYTGIGSRPNVAPAGFSGAFRIFRI
jgi:hypothetical protein